MAEGLDDLKSAVGAVIAKVAELTPAVIRETIKRFRLIYPGVTDEEAESLALHFETQHDVTMNLGDVLEDNEFTPWLNSRKPDIDPYYWERYKRLLVEDRELSADVVRKLDQETDRILDHLEDPSRPGSWDRRGLVVGHVQSGKTTNYIGLISKAADAGYKLIVVIAGIHNNLRQQTQSRIDEGFIGRDSSRELSLSGQQNIGVGNYNSIRRPVTFTTSIKDFNKQTATAIGVPLQTLTEPAIFVVKKNAHTLKNLLEWLADNSARGLDTKLTESMLLIDDEADNASINIRHGKDEVSTINRRIRQLLQLCQRSCYVGFTATPFANIFIEPDTDNEMLQEDLFPRHFIVSLEPPSNYCGANRIFQQDSTSFIRHIEDNEDYLPLIHQIDWQVVGLPSSMIQALRAFVVACAIRLVRGHDQEHCSMLVNTSRFTDVQSQLRYEIQSVLERIQDSIRIYGDLPSDQALKDPEMLHLHRTWQCLYQQSCDWPALQTQLRNAAISIRVVEVNSRSTEPLDYSRYKNGLRVIAVGGYSLSRGLTLEGLLVSYFLRNSMMYDTLMQMARWFGYRDGYEDLCRVWMTEEAEGWYEHIAESIEELRVDFRTMAARGATPEEFGLKVRSHPDTLIVTARSKMGSGQRVTVNIGLANRFCETALLKRDQASLDMNRQAAIDLGTRLKMAGYPVSHAKKTNRGWLLESVPVNPVVEFIREFQNHPGSNLTDTASVRRYIAKRDRHELNKWDILFASVNRKDQLVDCSLGIRINCQTRTAGKKSDSNSLYITNKQRVASRGTEKIGTTSSKIERAEREFRESLKRFGYQNTTINYPDRIYRAVRDRPLLIVHLLRILPEPNGVEHGTPVVAWGISFPQTKICEETVQYYVNSQWWFENHREDLDEEEMGGDDVA